VKPLTFRSAPDNSFGDRTGQTMARRLSRSISLSYAESTPRRGEDLARLSPVRFSRREFLPSESLRSSTYIHTGDTDVAGHMPKAPDGKGHMTTAPDEDEDLARLSSVRFSRREFLPSESSTYIHTGDTDVAGHMPKAPDGKGHMTTAPDKDTHQGHAVFGVGANFKSTHEFLEQPPDVEYIKKEGVLSKRIVANDRHVWSERYITLTSEKMYLRNEEGGNIRCMVLNISHVHLCSHRHTCVLALPSRVGGDALTQRTYVEHSLNATWRLRDVFDLLDISRVERMDLQPEMRTDGVMLMKERSNPSRMKRMASMIMTSSGRSLPDRASGTSDPSDDSALSPTADISRVLLDTAGGHGTMKCVSPGEHRLAGEIAEKTSLQARESKNVIEVYSQRLGRTYYLRAADELECAEWVAVVNEAIKEAAQIYDQSLNIGRRERFRLWVRKCYDSSEAQVLVSLLLLCNFIISIIQCQVGSDSETALSSNLDLAELVFTFVYTIELAINMYSHWFWGFFSSSWCLFDFIVVIFSLSGQNTFYSKRTHSIVREHIL